MYARWRASGPVVGAGVVVAVSAPVAVAVVVGALVSAAVFAGVLSRLRFGGLCFFETRWRVHEDSPWVNNLSLARV